MTYLRAEQLIKQRLVDQVTEVPEHNILSAADLEGIKENSQPVPALHVVFFDDNPTANKNETVSIQQSTEQNWLITVAVRNVRDKSGESARDEAGLLINQVLQALNGWHPDLGFMRMSRKKSPYRPTYRNGFFYFPMLFSVKMNTEGVKT